ncbi:hypothetical protein BaRGS_00018101 [Batillaria attramentaria]|uniref:Uncharacterized protein n=1 Tax=Batillaria attramentaria TaxID=370345 RepID=A0ABD0KTZ9_9CAEN
MTGKGNVKKTILYGKSLQTFAVEIFGDEKMPYMQVHVTVSKDFNGFASVVTIFLLRVITADWRLGSARRLSASRLAALSVSPSGS